MKDGQCPKCGAQAVYLFSGGSPAAPINAVRLSRTPRVNFAPVDTYVCVNCGYLENYVAHAEKLSYIADHWAQVAVPTARVERPAEADHPTRRLP